MQSYQRLRAVLFPGIYGQEVVSLYLPLSLAARGVPPSLGGIVQQVRLCLRGKVLRVGLRGILRAQLLQPPEWHR